jgi:hypothetical protein
MLINPKIPKHFFDRDIGLRSETEINKFWNVPIILTEEYEDHHDKTWTEYQERVSGPKNNYTIETEEEFNTWTQEKKEAWCKNFPTCTAYRVHCHDGGAWDRPTDWGAFGTLEEAVECAQTGPSWRKEQSNAINLKRNN